MLFRRLVFLLALLCGLAGTQVPEFAQQYRQRLGGTIDELNRMLADFDRQSASEGLARAQGIARLEANSDPLVTGRGTALAEAETREQRLEAQWNAMHAADPLSRLAAFASRLDPGVAQRTLDDFRPAVPVTLESVLVGLAAFVAALAVLHALAWPVRRHLRARRRRRLLLEA